MRTPSIVSDVSAMGVASTTLRMPGAEGDMAICCFSGANCPYSGHMVVGERLSAKSLMHLSMSAYPGRKARMSPSCAACAWRMVVTTA